MGIIRRVTGGTFSAGKIESFEELELSFSGMRGTTGYTARRVGDVVDITFYILRYRDGEGVRDVEGEARVSYTEFLDKLGACGAAGWDGFAGKHPRHVFDGEQFRLEMAIGEGRRIKAHGSANFPRGLMDLRRWLDEQLR